MGTQAVCCDIYGPEQLQLICLPAVMWATLCVCAGRSGDPRTIDFAANPHLSEGSEAAEVCPGRADRTWKQSQSGFQTPCNLPVLCSPLISHWQFPE